MLKRNNEVITMKKYLNILKCRRKNTEYNHFINNKKEIAEQLIQMVNTKN